MNLPAFPPGMGTFRTPFSPGVRQGAPDSSPVAPTAAQTEEPIAWRADEERMENPRYRWADDRFPLKVLLPEDSAREAPLFLSAFRQWEAALPDVIRFSPLSSPNEAASTAADLIFTWSDHTTHGREFETGHTDCVVRGVTHALHIVEARITLIRRPLIDHRLNASGRQERLLATVLHETGHALGLTHSRYPGDLMHHRNWRRITLAEGDIHALRELYSRK